MPENVKALISVLALAVPAFYVGRQLAASVIAPREFAIWRNVWFASTVAAFLSGSFLVFAAIIIMICLYAHAARAATAALFVVLLFAVPLVGIPIGGFGIVNALLDINHARLMAIVLLLPIMFARGGLGRRNGGIYLIPDRLIVGYVLLLIALQIQTSGVTQIMRFATLRTLDVLIPYFAFSRAVISMADVRKVLLAFVITVLPLSLIAVFETTKGWHLYSSIVSNWEDIPTMGYIQRGGILRATASTTGPIVLGFVIMVAVGCGLALRQTIGSRRFAGIALTIFGAALVATLSRGPWVGAMVLILVYLATSPNAVANLARFAVIGAIVLLPLLFTPVGNWLLDLLPFIGSIDAGTVTYRQHLFDNAILVIERNLWFGSSDYLLTPEMREMVQGEQIIDIVNTYLEIALDSGLVGLGFFLGFFATILIGLWRVLKFEVIRDLGFGAYIRASMATLVAMLVTIATVSSIDFIPLVYWSFAGLCVALIRIAYRERAAVARAAVASQVLA
jgi:O-antigen ligase